MVQWSVVLVNPAPILTLTFDILTSNVSIKDHTPFEAALLTAFQANVVTESYQFRLSFSLSISHFPNKLKLR